MKNESESSNYVPPVSINEIVQRYGKGERYFAFTELEDKADFSQIKLPGAIFDNSIISDADFTGADLRGVSFRNSNVKCNNFSNANLESADFHGALVEATCFAGANLKGASFNEVSYYGITIQEAQVPALLKDLCIPFEQRYTYGA